MFRSKMVLCLILFFVTTISWSAQNRCSRQATFHQQPSAIKLKASVDVIRAKLGDIHPEVGILLGSGLGGIADSLEKKASIPYTAIPGFPQLKNEGHNGQLSFGYIKDTPIVCLEGRVHYYEGDKSEEIKHYIRTLQALGCKTLIITTATGSLRKDIAPGNIAVVSDHINMFPTNPLVGPNDEEVGPRFLPLEDPYDPEIIAQLQKSAKSLNISLYDVILLSYTGPYYETAAETRAFRRLGADLVGMSTIPELLVARHSGMKVAAIASVTDYATGLSKEEHSHEKVLAVANKTSHDIQRLIMDWLDQKPKNS